MPNLPAPPSEKWFTVTEIATMFAVDDSTVRRWIRDKHFDQVKRTKPLGGSYIVSAASVDRFKEKIKMQMH